jgi:hypothetical protein
MLKKTILAAAVFALTGAVLTTSSSAMAGYYGYSYNCPPAYRPAYRPVYQYRPIYRPVYVAPVYRQAYVPAYGSGY